MRSWENIPDEARLAEAMLLRKAPSIIRSEPLLQHHDIPSDPFMSSAYCLAHGIRAVIDGSDGNYNQGANGWTTLRTDMDGDQTAQGMGPARQGTNVDSNRDKDPYGSMIAIPCLRLNLAEFST